MELFMFGKRGFRLLTGVPSAEQSISLTRFGEER